MEQAQAVSAALEQLHQASQAMGVQGIHGMGMPLPPGHTQHEQAMQLPLQHQVGCSGLASGELQGCGYRMSRCPPICTRSVQPRQMSLTCVAVLKCLLWVN